MDRYLSDPLCGFTPSNAFFSHLLHGLHAVNQPDAFNLDPAVGLYIASGAVDPVGGAKAVGLVSHAYQESGVRDVETHVCPNDRHEIFNETDKDVVWQDFARWLNRICEA